MKQGLCICRILFRHRQSFQFFA